MKADSTPLTAYDDRPWRKKPEAVELKSDLDEARRFLSILDGSAEAFTFATFDDGQKPKNQALTCNCLHGDLGSQADKLIANNARGAGVFVMVSAGDGKGRAFAHVTRIRAVWGEFDAGMPENLPLTPSMVVETSPGKFHCYWLCDGLAIPEHRPIMERIVRSYNGDGQAKDEARVLRVPGFYHRKGAPFQVHIIAATGEIYSRDEIISAFPPYVEERIPPSPVVSYPIDDEDDREKLLSALDAIPSDPRDTWVKVGMALKHKFGDAGRPIWEQWAAKSEKYDTAGSRKWASFGRRDGVTVGSIFHWAKENGWKWEPPAYKEDPAIKRMIQSVIENAEKKAEAANVVAFPVPETQAPENSPSEFIFEENFKAEMPPALIRGVLPRNGLVVDGGQSGAGKTFAEVDMAVALATGEDWFGHPCRERVGVLYIAAEGQSSIQRRFIAAKRYRGAEGEALPIAVPNWASVNLRDQKKRLEIIHKLKAVDAQMRDRFGVRLGCIILDTISSSCPMKDENNNAEVAIVCRELREIADATDAVLVAVHHFGKSEDSGLRGGSAWRCNCDHSRIFMARRDGPGCPAKDRRMALDKNRLGAEGEMFKFELAVVPFGKDAYGDDVTECAIQIEGKAERKPKLSKPQKDFFKAYNKAFAGYVHTEHYGLRPHANGVPIEFIRNTYLDEKVTGQERLSPTEAKSKNRSWTRAFEAVIEGEFFLGENVNGIEWVWPAEGDKR